MILVLSRSLDSPLVPEGRCQYSGFTHQETEGGGLWPCLTFAGQLLSQLGLDPSLMVSSHLQVLGESLAGTSEVREDTWQVTLLYRPRTQGPAPVPTCPYVETALLEAQQPKSGCPSASRLISTGICALGGPGACVFEPSLLMCWWGRSWAPV